MTGAMKISQKGLYALQAMMMLARHYHQGAMKIREIAYEAPVQAPPFVWSWRFELGAGHNSGAGSKPLGCDLKIPL
jgi:hypothetical protein